MTAIEAAILAGSRQRLMVEFGGVMAGESTDGQVLLLCSHFSP